MVWWARKEGIVLSSVVVWLVWKVTKVGSVLSSVVVVGGVEG